MRFGICVMANVDEIGFFSHAETLGYDSVWVTDSQMLFSDCYAVLALTAPPTSWSSACARWSARGWPSWAVTEAFARRVMARV